jgi:hypothetical protein
VATDNDVVNSKSHSHTNIDAEDGEYRSTSMLLLN